MNQAGPVADSHAKSDGGVEPHGFIVGTSVAGQFRKVTIESQAISKLDKSTPSTVESSHTKAVATTILSGSRPPAADQSSHVAMDDLPFAELLRRVRNGEAEATYVLVQRYESAIRVAIRTRLSDPALRRQLDSVDICQSVLASFFLRAAAGQYDLHEPAQLVALLTKMAKNKLAMQARRHFQQKRDVRRVSSLAHGDADAVPDSADPFRQVVGREMLDRAYFMMDDEVRQIADRRLRGEGWTAIASDLGGTADGRRKQYERAIDRIAADLQIE